MVGFIMTPQTAISRLQQGNKKYIASMQCIGDTSQSQREKTLSEGHAGAQRRYVRRVGQRFGGDIRNLAYSFA